MTVRSGFYASKNENDVFAYSARDHDAVWLKIGSLDLSGDEPEGEWVLPDHDSQMEVWLKKYGFSKITTALAQPALASYLYGVIAMLTPDNNKEILRDPSTAVTFVRLVQDFATQLGEM